MTANPPASERPGGAVLPLQGEGLSVHRDGRTLLYGVSVMLATGGGITVLIGPNGAGKSLLIRCLAGLVAPDEGTVTWNGSSPDPARRPRIGFVLQRPVMLRRSSRDNILYALAVTGLTGSDAENIADSELQHAGLGAIAATNARHLSGGEQQRLALARALALKPDVLFLDEPAANLDPASTAAIEARLQDVVAAGVHAILVTQDLKQARRLATSIIMMHNGRILEHTPAPDFFAKPRSATAQKFLDGALLIDGSEHLKAMEKSS